MLLMKERSFLYELRACLIYVNVGEKTFQPIARTGPFSNISDDRSDFNSTFFPEISNKTVEILRVGRKTHRN